MIGQRTLTMEEKYSDSCVPYQKTIDSGEIELDDESYGSNGELQRDMGTTDEIKIEVIKETSDEKREISRGYGFRERVSYILFHYVLISFFHYGSFFFVTMTSAFMFRFEYYWQTAFVIGFLQWIIFDTTVVYVARKYKEDFMFWNIGELTYIMNVGLAMIFTIPMMLPFWIANVEPILSYQICAIIANHIIIWYINLKEINMLYDRWYPVQWLLSLSARQMIFTDINDDHLRKIQNRVWDSLSNMPDFPYDYPEQLFIPITNT